MVFVDKASVKRRGLLILFFMVLILLPALGVFHWQSQDILSSTYQCASLKYAQNQLSELNQSAENSDNDFFFKRYFLIPSLARTKENLSKFMNIRTEDCEPQLPADVISLLDVVYPFYRANHLTTQQEINQIVMYAKKQEETLKSKKSEVLAELQEDLKKYYFFLNQALTTKKTLNLVLGQCRLPASGRVRECQRSASRLKMTLEKEEGNLKLNYQILIEKWMPYREWIDQEIASFEKQKLGQI